LNAGVDTGASGRSIGRGRLRSGPPRGDARQGDDLCRTIAVRKAITAGAREIDTVVAVHDLDDSPREASVISPRGVCRELVYDYGPDADAIVPGESGSTKRSKRSISELLPSRWH